jgi:glycosyltransferase involved in cell wall biosynthesis
MSTVSLIVATYNWPEALDVCLLSIRNQTAFPHEVIIADDGSTYETKRVIEILQKDFPVPLIHVWQKDLGFRKSLVLNKAIAAASGDYVVQIDGDVILDKHFIHDHKSVAEEGHFVRGTRAHIPQNLVKDTLKQKSINYSYFSPGLVHRFNALRIPWLAFLIEKKSQKSNGVRGSNVAFWKNDFILVNGYDNELTGWGHEDEELAARFINNGIWRKSVKFKCVQFHLYHTVSCYLRKPLHVDAVEHTRQYNLKISRNGIANLKSAQS